MSRARVINYSLALLLFLACGALVTLSLAESFRDRRSLLARSAFLQSVGVASLAVSADCTSTRSLIEGLCGCLGDVPGSYCVHQSCDLLGVPQVGMGSIYRLRRAKPSDSEGT